MLELIFEKFFLFFVSITNSYGLAVLLISVVVSIGLAPFYYITGILENKEKLIRLKLQPHILQINKIKDANIRHVQLSELYKSYDYFPIKSLRSLSSLIIQIPVFIVAYNVLSKLFSSTTKNIVDMSFLFIKSLGNQDGLLYGVNLLPILMTLINVVSVMLMTKYSKERKQGYSIAVLFFIVLYKSPAGLVLYWTSNNFINFLRYFFFYLKQKSFISVKHDIKNFIFNLLKDENTRVFLFLVSMYYLINVILPSGIKNFSIVSIFPFYILGVLKIHDYIIARSNVNKYFKLQLALLILIFSVSIFVVRWEKAHWMIALLILIEIYNINELKISKIKKLLQSSVLPVVTILFPAVFYAKEAKGIYFPNLTSLLLYFIILIIFSIVLPVIIYVFNNRLSLMDIIKYSISFILSAMFLPLVRNYIDYSQNIPIDFIFLFAIVLFIISFVYKHKKALCIFLLCAAIGVCFFNINVNNKHAKNPITNDKGDISSTDVQIASIPNDLLEMKIKDASSIYLFMYDAFPHKDLIKKLGLDRSKVDEFLEKYKFKEYNVYSLGTHTLTTMDSVLNMDKPDHADLKFGLDDHRSRIANNFVQKVLSKAWYEYFVEAGNDHWVFNTDLRRIYYNKSLKFYSSAEVLTENKLSFYIIQALIYGTINTEVLGDIIYSSSKSFKLSDFACLDINKDRDHLFGWCLRGPGHSSSQGHSYDWEKEQWLPRYYKSIDDMMSEISKVIDHNPNAIIILMSDHGPCLFYDNDEERQKVDLYTQFRDLYGSFMAIRWPDKEKASKYDKDFNVTQDLFAIIFAYLYGSEEPLKYKIHDTSIRLCKRGAGTISEEDQAHMFDKGVVYPNYYKNK